MTVIEEEDVSSYRVTLRKMENNNKLKVDALDLWRTVLGRGYEPVARERERTHLVCVVILTTYVRKEFGQLWGLHICS